MFHTQHTHTKMIYDCRQYSLSGISLLCKCNSVMPDHPNHRVTCVTHKSINKWSLRIPFFVSRALEWEVSVRICNDWSDWSSVTLTAYSHYFLHNWFIIPVAGIERHWFFPSSRSITVDKQVFVLERLGRSPLEAIFTISLGFLVRQIFWYSNT